MLAKQTGIITIESGTKGGRVHKLQITNKKQITILEKASDIQGDQQNMIPTELSWSQYQNQCKCEIQKTDIKFCGVRHHYANEREH